MTRVKPKRKIAVQFSFKKIYVVTHKIKKSLRQIYEYINIITEPRKLQDITIQQQENPIYCRLYTYL